MAGLDKIKKIQPYEKFLCYIHWKKYRERLKMKNTYHEHTKKTTGIAILM